MEKYNKLIKLVNERNIDAYKMQIFDIETSLDEFHMMALLMHCGSNHLFLKETILAISDPKILEFDNSNRILNYAIENSWEDIVELLMQKGVNSNLPDGRHLARAKKMLNVNIISLLISYGASEDLAKEYECKDPDEKIGAYPVNYTKINDQ